MTSPLIALAPDDLLFAYRWNADTLTRLADDIDDARFADQPVPHINHPAWLIGHVSAYNDVVLALLTGQPFDNPWTLPCGKDRPPVADRSAYPSKPELIQRFTTGVDTAVDAIASAEPAAWSAPVEHATWGKQFARVASAVSFLTSAHLAYHTGQLSSWRRAAGMPRGITAVPPAPPSKQADGLP
ncbi:MAG: DinB family protein [Planctomycetota bacterium]